MTDKPREQEQCPFCGGKVGLSNTLCGSTPSANGLSEKWWCRYQAYTIRHADKTSRGHIQEIIDGVMVGGWNKHDCVSAANCALKSLDGGDEQ